MTCILHYYIKDNDLMAQNVDPADSEPNWKNLLRQGENAHNSSFLVKETEKTIL